MPNLGANLRAKTQRLGTLVDDFSTARAVVLRSDKLTDVTLYRVGRFGRFSEHRLMLRPGEYTAVGSRIGYRDVRYGSLLQYILPGGKIRSDGTAG